MGRRGPDGGRAFARWKARILRKLATNWCSGGPAFVDIGVWLDLEIARERNAQLGLARFISSEHPSRRRGFVRQAGGGGIAGVRADKAGALGGEAPDTRHAPSSPRRRAAVAGRAPCGKQLILSIHGIHSDIRNAAEDWVLARFG